MSRLLYASETLEGFNKARPWGAVWSKVFASPYPIDEEFLRKQFGDRYVDLALDCGVLSEVAPMRPLSKEA